MNHNSIGGERVPETWVVEELIKEGKNDTTKNYKTETFPVITLRDAWKGPKDTLSSLQNTL